MIKGEFKNLIKYTADFILPRFCCSCKIKLNTNENTICLNCISRIQNTTPQRLAREYERKFLNKNIITDFFAPYVFEKDKELQHAIHSLKYDRKFLVGVYLGKLAAKNMIKHFPNWHIDLIIPIPLHQLKKAERGFNQSFYIAKGFSIELKKKYSDRIVKRIKYTESQTTMTLIEREENISNAFVLRNKKIIKGKSILLIDDVITTGATISECGKILLEAGALKIYAASVAITD